MSNQELSMSMFASESDYEEAVAKQTEQAAFESWALPLGFHMVPSRRTPGMYESMSTQDAWEGWKARAILAAKEQA